MLAPAAARGVRAEALPAPTWRPKASAPAQVALAERQRTVAAAAGACCVACVDACSALVRVRAEAIATALPRRPGETAVQSTLAAPQLAVAAQALPFGAHISAASCARWPVADAGHAILDLAPLRAAIAGGLALLAHPVDTPRSPRLTRVHATAGDVGVARSRGAARLIHERQTASRVERAALQHPRRAASAGGRACVLAARTAVGALAGTPLTGHGVRPTATPRGKRHAAADRPSFALNGAAVALVFAALAPHTHRATSITTSRGAPGAAATRSELAGRRTFRRTLGLAELTHVGTADLVDVAIAAAERRIVLLCCAAAEQRKTHQDQRKG